MAPPLNIPGSLSARTVLNSAGGAFIHEGTLDSGVSTSLAVASLAATHNFHAITQTSMALFLSNSDVQHAIDQAIAKEVAEQMTSLGLIGDALARAINTEAEAKKTAFLYAPGGTSWWSKAWIQFAQSLPADTPVIALAPNAHFDGILGQDVLRVLLDDGKVQSVNGLAMARLLTIFRGAGAGRSGLEAVFNEVRNASQFLIGGDGIGQFPDGRYTFTHQFASRLTARSAPVQERQ